MSTMVFDSDDFGATHIISDMCQSHDCRDALYALKSVNPKFKATMFAIPGEMTPELLNWCAENRDWIEIAVHGFFHTSNYECEKLTYDEFDHLIQGFKPMIDTYYTKGFKAPGWQISTEIFHWLRDNGWWVADQEYNNGRRPADLPVYLIQDFSVHTHTWNCVGNGIYELIDQLLEQVEKTTNFHFVSEVLQR